MFLRSYPKLRYALCFPLLAETCYSENHTLGKVTTQAKRIFTYNNEFKVTSKELDQRQSNEVKDLFRTNPDVNVGGGSVMGQKIYVRGVEDRLLRVTVDGAAQNGNIYHHQGNTVIDPGMLKSVEVTKGSANASAGPGAIAGVIKMETKGAADFIPRGKSYAASGAVSFYTNFGDRETFRSAYQGAHFDIIAYYTHQNIFYYRSGATAMKNLFKPTQADKEPGTPSEQNNALVKMNGYLSDRDTLTFSWNMTRDNATRPLRSNAIGLAYPCEAPFSPDGAQGCPNVLDSFTRYMYHSINSTNNLSLQYKREAGNSFGDPRLDFTLYTSIRNAQFDPLFDPNEVYARFPTSLASAWEKENYPCVEGAYCTPSFSDVDKPSSQPRNLFLNNTGLNLKVAHVIDEATDSLFEYGFNYQNLSVFDARIPKSELYRPNQVYTDDKGQKQIACSLVDNNPNDPTLCQRGKANGNIYGGYVQANYSPHQIITFGAGVRWDAYTLYDKDWNHRYTQGFSPSAALVLSPIEPLSLKITYSQVTRGVMPGDGVYMRQNDLRYAKNIKPEVGSNAEFNIDYSSQYFSGRAAAFYQALDNFISQYAQSLIVTNLNQAIRIYGYEVGGTFKYKGVSLNVGVSRTWPTTRGYLMADSYELAASTGNVFIIKLDYTIPKTGINLAWLSRFVTGLDYCGFDIYLPDYGTAEKPKTPTDLAKCGSQLGLVHMHKPGYGVSNFYINWSPKTKSRWKGLLLSAVFNNVFNKFYVDQTSPYVMSPDMPGTDAVKRAIAEPGFNARFEVAYKW
ncbi:TonB-dependent receptor [Helicobacter pylori]|uniref:TonB-dependent receptor n=1 Tax=Helicobacter pylori TaxID=210 RepID=UPI000EB5A41D|nr:TonB-dependent receptor [Helicobacter pylori]